MQRVKALALLLTCSLLVACASVVGPRTYEIPLTRLQEGLDRHFSRTHRVLPLFEIQLGRAQLTLMPEQGRISLAISPTLSPPLINQTWSGNLIVSGRLVIDATRSIVYVSDARVDRFDFDGVDAQQQLLIGKVVNVIAQKVIKDIPVITFRPEELRVAGVQFVPTNILMTATALVVTLESVK
jgi:hypothetical protein